jgi:uncharacterized phage protein (TIGR02218 family)
MLPVSTDLAAALDAGTSLIIRHLVTITPTVGSPVYLTDNDADLVYGGHTFKRGGGTVPLVHLIRRRMAAGTEISDLEMELLCGDAALFNGERVPVAAADGALRGAWVLVERVFMPTAGDLSLGTMHVFEGTVSEVRPSATRVEITVEGLMGLLDAIQVPRTTFQPGCNNALFDAQCGLAMVALTYGSTVTAGATTTTIPSAAAGEYYVGGVITFTATGVSRAVKAYSAGAFILDRPLPSAPAAGALFTVYPGCDKQRATCQTKFANLDRFRGFPFVPKSEITR